MRKVRRMRIRRGTNKKWLFLLPCCLMAALTVFLLIDAKVRPMIRTLAVNQARVLAVNAIDREVTEYMETLTDGDGGFLNVAKDNSGEIISIESNSVKMNRVKSEINLAVTQRLQEMGEQTVNIPSGSLSGIAMLYGKGSEIHVTLTMSGHSTADISEDFTTAGINQTLHRVLLTIQAEVYIVLPGYSQSESIRTDFVLAQTVIVGDIPSFYAGIGGSLE